MNKFLETLEPYSDEKSEGRPLKFRNYVPKDEGLRAFVMKAPTLIAEIELGVEREVKNTLKEFEVQQKEPLCIAPKKANWDLKKKLEYKMQKISQKTEESIKKLIKEQKKNK